MRLSNLEKYNELFIQMHDNPDADAVGSGYALYKYFESRGKRVRLVYGGRCKITKSNICLLIQELKIPVEYLNELETPLEKPELLLTVDCQYGEGNVQYVEAAAVAMVDHHNTGRESDDMCEIRSNLVSCATICYDLLKAEGFEVNRDMSVATALYYGLFMDSNEFSEIRHALERDMLDFLRIDHQLFNRLTHANFTLEEFETAGMAMLRYNYNESKKLAIIKAKPCDPGILGLVGDFVLQVDSIDLCIIYNEISEGYKLSLRSCRPDVTANELAEYLTENIGNGGGHLNKAGGFISKNKYRNQFGDLGIDTYIFSRAEEYFNSYEVIYANEGIQDTSEFRLYTRRSGVDGYVKTLDFLEPGTECKVRTYEGDVVVKASEDIYLMIGVVGEVYPIEREKFNLKYTGQEKPFYKEFEYAPTVIDLHTMKRFELLPYANQCLRKKEAVIYAKELKVPVKIFSRWKYEKYMYGNAGDYICYSPDDPKDVYTVKKQIFEKTYQNDVQRVIS
ncbi:MAG: bifunctional oligoribonuclease/PAP phosphatase NrnA [Acetatifactor sp.]